MECKGYTKTKLSTLAMTCETAREKYGKVNDGINSFPDKG